MGRGGADRAEKLRIKIVDLTQEEDIRKTALIIAGDVLGDDYELSKLYDEHFSTEYRNAEN